MNIHLSVGLELVKWHLEGMYGAVEEGRDEEGNRAFRVRWSYISYLVLSA
jgi:cleavage and polyadenylation specificity factor subunit 3